MIGPNVRHNSELPSQPLTTPSRAELLAADPLSQILERVKPQTYVAGGFAVTDEISIQFPQHRGIKCYALLSGQCWIDFDGGPAALRLEAGDCILLPRGIPFRLTTDLALQPVHYQDAFAKFGLRERLPDDGTSMRYLAGGHFTLGGAATELLLQTMPAIVHIRSEADRSAMRWSLERMRIELSRREPGSTLVVQQLAYLMLIQALRLHLTDAASTGRGWLAALADPQLSRVLAAMHNEPGGGWTLETLAQQGGMSRTVFAERFRRVLGTTPIEYLTRWRMLEAVERMRNRSESLASIAHALGYESESAFGKAFRRVLGCAPRQYHRLALENS